MLSLNLCCSLTIELNGQKKLDRILQWQSPETTECATGLNEQQNKTWKKMVCFLYGLFEHSLF